MTTLLDEPCFVYHCYIDDELAYIGASIDPDLRLEQHKSVAPWAHHVNRIESTRFDTGREALAVEAADIKRLRPRWNLGGRGPRATWQLSDYVEVLMVVLFKRRGAADGWSRECVDKRVARLSRELVWGWPDIGPVILADLGLSSEQVAA